MEAVYYQPDTLEDVPAMLKNFTEKSVILAGGTDLLIQIRNKKPEIDCYLSLWKLEELRTIELQDGWLKIGSMVTHQQGAENPLIQKYFRALSMACRNVGSQQVRNKGTLGGNIMNASPAGDIIPCIWMFEGEVEFLTSDGKKRILMQEFLKNRDKKEKEGVLTAIYLPLPAGEHPRESCFFKLGQREQVTIAQISICTVWEIHGTEKRNVKMYMGAVNRFPTVCNCADLLEGEWISEEHAAEAAWILRKKIAEIRTKRSRPPKLKLTEGERLYKERAVKGLLFDVVKDMNERRGGQS